MIAVAGVSKINLKFHQPCGLHFGTYIKTRNKLNLKKKRKQKKSYIYMAASSLIQILSYFNLVCLVIYSIWQKLYHHSVIIRGFFKMINFIILFYISISFQRHNKLEPILYSLGYMLASSE